MCMLKKITLVIYGRCVWFSEVWSHCRYRSRSRHWKYPSQLLGCLRCLRLQFYLLWLSGALRIHVPISKPWIPTSLIMCRTSVFLRLSYYQQKKAMLSSKRRVIRLVSFCITISTVDRLYGTSCSTVFWLGVIQFSWTVLCTWGFQRPPDVNAGCSLQVMLHVGAKRPLVYL